MAVKVCHVLVVVLDVIWENELTTDPQHKRGELGGAHQSQPSLMLTRTEDRSRHEHTSKCTKSLHNFAACRSTLKLPEHIFFQIGPTLTSVLNVQSETFIY